MDFEKSKELVAFHRLNLNKLIRSQRLLRKKWLELDIKVQHHKFEIEKLRGGKSV